MIHHMESRTKEIQMEFLYGDTLANEPLNLKRTKILMESRMLGICFVHPASIKHVICSHTPKIAGLQP